MPFFVGCAVPDCSRYLEKKKWTPIPPAEMQEALDKAEKARKAALTGGVEGAKQKRRNSTVAGADDTYQGAPKAGTKKNPQASAKAGGKTTTASPAPNAAETSGKKTKATPAAAGKQANVVRSSQGIVSEENVPVALGSGLVPAPIENSRHANGSRLLDRDIGLTQVPSGESGDSSATNEREVQNEQTVPFPSLVVDSGSPKRKLPVSERQKGQSGPAVNRPGASTAVTNNHHVQMRDVARGGVAAGRGGRGHGGKTARGGSNASGLKYGDNGMATSPRGQSKSALVSPPHGGYNGLPFESNMAAAVHAPGFVPYGTQPPYPFYPQGYYYGANASGAGVSSSGSDSGQYDSATNAQQGGQQAFAPYNMGYVPQQRPVTEIPGLDTLRYYILGQIEYYFSITNLCMDQFLRGQVCVSGCLLLCSSELMLLWRLFRWMRMAG
jgi:la-related protein 1